jgi:hypothetical protein
MNCPYCHQEMEEGFFQTGVRSAWTKHIHKFSLLPKEGEVMLTNHVFLGSRFRASICKRCKKVLVDYSDK